MANSESATPPASRPQGSVAPFPQADLRDQGESAAIGSPDILQQLQSIQHQLAAFSQGPAPLVSEADRDVCQQIELLRQDVSALTESLQAQLTSAVDSLQNSQSAAAKSQGEIIRTLTEAIFSSSSSQTNDDHLTVLFSEFESRICSTIRETLAQSHSRDKFAASTSPEDARSTGKPSERSTETAAPVVGEDSGKPQSWDAIRRALLNDSSLDSASPQPPGASESHLRQEGGAASAREPVTRPAGAGVSRTDSSQEYKIGDNDLPLEIPDPVDIDALDAPSLRQALREREQLICSIIGRMRRQSYTSNDMLTTDQLRALIHEMPEQFAVRVNHTLQRIDDQLRLGELELSLERARLGRQASQLDYVRQQVEHNARQLGYTVNSDGTLSSEGAMMPRSSSSRRWLGKLGFSE